VLYNSGEKQC